MFDDEDEGNGFNRMEPDKKARIMIFIAIGLALVFAFLLLIYNVIDLF